MPVTRRQQILAKIESSEGQNANPTGSDAILVYEPELSQEVDTVERVPAGSSMSRAFDPVGRKKRSVKFTSDFRGSADTTIPITLPEWGTLGQGAGLRPIQPIQIPVTSVSGTLGYQLGEIVQKGSSAIRGVVIGLFSSGAIVHRLTGSGTVVVAPIAGTFTSTGTLTGESSGTTGTIGTVASYAGLCFAPTSDKRMNVTTGSWSASAPAAGDTALVKASGIIVGICQIVVDNAAGAFTDIDVVLLQGTISNGNTLTVGAKTATISAAPTQSRTPSLTIAHNLDGRRRSIVGSRGDFELSGESGQPLKFTWTFEGDSVAAVDALPATTSALSSVIAPRLLGALIAYGQRVDTTAGDTATDFVRLATKSLNLKASNTVSANLDANAAGGTVGSNVTDRKPVLNAVVNEVQSGFDWDAIVEYATPVRFIAILGTTPGNIVGIVVPNAQAKAAPIGDSDGLVTRDVSLEPKRVLESGDDEYFLVQL